MFAIGINFEFSAGHTIYGHQGKCARIHGHNYSGIVTVNAVRLDELGMVMDFSHLKRAVRELTDELDHYLLMWKSDPRLPALLNAVQPSIKVMQHQTTVENLARYLGSELWTHFRDEPALDMGISISGLEVMLNETAECFANYSLPTHGYPESVNHWKD